MKLHYETRYQHNFIAKLSEQDGQCDEIVFFNGQQIHRATFPASNLGAASRSGYLESMVASVAREHRNQTYRVELVFDNGLGQLTKQSTIVASCESDARAIAQMNYPDFKVQSTRKLFNGSPAD